ncbi:MAG: hypothetical protein JNL74_04050 [Fibrobacteres bacterium]|nr:hypothetical protein [Fibrobacterota bacterium]
MKKYFILALSIILVGALFSQDFDEAAMFADTATVTEKSMATDESILADEKKTGFSGTITSALNVIFPKKDFDTPLSSPSLTADLFLDARLKGGIKGFISSEIVYVPKNDSITLKLPEAFVDVNFNNKIYVRTGKQVLQWGRGQFWNPTDLINVERKKQDQEIGLRNGTYGLKIHVPFGTKLNFYGFANMKNVDSLENTAGSFKTEFTVRATEMAVGIWAKKNMQPVFSYDFSTALLGLNVAGEASLFRKDNENFASIIDDTLKIISGEKKWSSRAALTLNRSFNINGVPSRLNLAAEGFYNGTGYSIDFIENAIKAKSEKPMFSPIEYALISGAYTPMQLSKYYVALFATYNRFINSNMTLYVRIINNIEQQSALLYTYLVYTDLRDISIALGASQGFGAKNSEFTLDMIPTSNLNVSLTASISF